MTRLAALAALVAMATLVVGCSSPEPTVSPATSPTASASPTEPETCRRDMREVLDLLSAIGADDSLSAERLDELSGRASDLSDAASVTCSRAVALPLSKAMYAFARANFYWPLCDDQACRDKVERLVLSGLRAVDRTEAAVYAVG